MMYLSLLGKNTTCSLSEKYLAMSKTFNALTYVIAAYKSIIFYTEIKIF